MSEKLPLAIQSAMQRNEELREQADGFMSTQYIMNKLRIGWAHKEVMGVEVLEAAIEMPGDNNSAIDIELSNEDIQVLEDLGNGDVLAGARNLIERHGDANAILTEEQTHILRHLGANAEKYDVQYDHDKQTPVIFRNHDGVALDDPLQNDLSEQSADKYFEAARNTPKLTEAGTFYRAAQQEIEQISVASHTPQSQSFTP